jgi:hypothetical protein
MSPRVAAAVRTVSPKRVPQARGAGRLDRTDWSAPIKAGTPQRTEGADTTWADGRDFTTVPVIDRVGPQRSGWPGPGAVFVPEYPSAARRATAEPGAAERQADLVGARIGNLLDAVRVTEGPLPQAVRDGVEPVFGLQFDGVRLDVGPGPAQHAERETARAVTTGTRIAFADGAFSPGTPAGQRLIGHELTHVAQQRAHGIRTTQRFAAVLDYERLARDIESAVSGPGTDEAKIYRTLTLLHREPGAVKELQDTYQRLFGEPLLKALRGDLNDEEFDYASGLLGLPVAAGSKQRIDPVAPVAAAGWDALARRLKAAADYRTWGFLGGTDEEAIFAVLQPLAGDAEKIANIKAAYARITGGPGTALVDMLHDELSGAELDHALELMAVRDPHAGTQAQLSRDQVLAVRNELLPGTAVTAPPVGMAPLPAPEPWDGRTGAPGAAAKRTALKTELITDLTNHLARHMPDITLEAGAPRVPLTALEGAANAAVEVTDDEYRSFYAVSAATPSQAAHRAGFAFTRAAGNLLDANSPADRAATGAALSAREVARWMVLNDDPPAPPGAIEHMAAHKYDPDRSAAESTFLEMQVITPFVAPAARNAKLRQYDQFGFALQPQPGKILIPTTAMGSSLGSGGAVPNLADRQMMWQTWHLAVHEYLHNLTHPAFDKAVASAIMQEGFTEFFTKKLLSKIAPVAHLDQGLVQKVEGGTFLPATTPAIVGPYVTDPTYAADLTHVENMAATVPGGENAVRSAYFQGHVEMLGIDPVTHRFITTPPASVDPSLVSVPAGIVTLADLADRSGVPEQSIRTANPGLPVVGLPPRVRLPGAREHQVAATFVPAGLGPRETKEQIAQQNGVSLAALMRANPAVNWAALTLGQRVLIPRV